LSNILGAFVPFCFGAKGGFFCAFLAISFFATGFFFWAVLLYNFFEEFKHFLKF